MPASTVFPEPLVLCPNCSVEPDKPNHDRRTFECPLCDYSHTEVVKYAQNQKSEGAGCYSCYRGHFLRCLKIYAMNSVETLPTLSGNNYGSPTSKKGPGEPLPGNTHGVRGIPSGDSAAI
jgi:hypothetical protein